MGKGPGQRQAGVWLGTGEGRYAGHFGSRYVLRLDKNAIKNSSLPQLLSQKIKAKENKNLRVGYSRGMGFLCKDFTVQGFHWIAC